MTSERHIRNIVALVLKQRKGMIQTGILWHNVSTTLRINHRSAINTISWITCIFCCLNKSLEFTARLSAVTPNILGGTWRHICSPDSWSVSVLSVYITVLYKLTLLTYLEWTWCNWLTQQTHNIWHEISILTTTIIISDVKLGFFRNRSSSRDNRLLTDHRNQGNISGRR